MSCTWFYVGRVTEGDTGAPSLAGERHMRLVFWRVNLCATKSTSGGRGTSWLMDPIRDENSPLYSEALPPEPWDSTEVRCKGAL